MCVRYAAAELAPCAPSLDNALPRVSAARRGAEPSLYVVAGLKAAERHRTAVGREAHRSVEPGRSFNLAPYCR